VSLIDDALKRAASEGTRRETAAPPDAARPWTPPPLPEPRRRTWPWAAAAAGIAAAVTAALLWTREVKPPAPEPAGQRPAAASVPEPAATPAAVPARTTVALPGPGGAPASAAKAPATARRVTQSRAGEASSAPQPAPASPGQESAAPEASAPAPAVEAPAGVAGIVLEGIVWSETEPVAMINGRILRVGGAVEGYIITKIEPQAVELQGERGTIRLTVGSSR
jgi:hypothetical protein